MEPEQWEITQGPLTSWGVQMPFRIAPEILVKGDMRKPL